MSVKLQFFLLKMIRFDESLEKNKEKLCIFMSNHFHEINLIWREFGRYATNKFHCYFIHVHDMCGNYRNFLLSQLIAIFYPKFRESNVFTKLKNLLNSWFDEIFFFGESKFIIFPHLEFQCQFYKCALKYFAIPKATILSLPKTFAIISSG